MSSSKSLSYYDETASKFYAKLDKHAYEKYRYELISHFLVVVYLKKTVSETKEKQKLKLLDVGSGNAFYTIGRILRKKDLREKLEIQGSDFSSGMIKEARKLYPKTKFTVCDAQDLKFKDQSFDVVVSREMLEHLPDKLKGLKEMHRVLKDNGKLILSTPSWFGLVAPLYFLKKRFKTMQPIDDWFTPFSLKKLLREAGFKVESLTTINYVLYHGKLPNFLVPIVKFLDKIISFIPVLNYFGRNLIVFARKV
ncbi:MAG: class I SAM-dependent methyltransferase [archaeon]